MGRPRKGDFGRKETVTIRLTADEKRTLKRCADRLGMNQTEVIVNGIGIIDGMIKKHQERMEPRKTL